MAIILFNFVLSFVVLLQFLNIRASARFQNFESLLSSNFFSGGQTRQTHATRNSARAIQKSKARSNTEKVVRVFSLRTLARAHTHTHVHSQRGSATGARVFQKKKDLRFRFKTLSLPGEEKFEKRCPRVRPDETRPRPIRRNKSWSN